VVRNLEQDRGPRLAEKRRQNYGEYRERPTVEQVCYVPPSSDMTIKLAERGLRLGFFHV
jgi:hypothetical protein